MSYPYKITMIVVGLLVIGVLGIATYQATVSNKVVVEHTEYLVLGATNTYKAPTLQNNLKPITTTCVSKYGCKPLPRPIYYCPPCVYAKPACYAPCYFK